MKKLVAASLLSVVLAAPAFAGQHKVTHPQTIHPQNPYLTHPNHKMLRGHHKKI
jgi:hypothetical protein